MIRALTAAEVHALQQGLRSAEAFVLRRCQRLLASARGRRARELATLLGGDDQTVRNAIPAFNACGLAALRRGAAAPHRTPHAIFDSGRREPLWTLRHQRPRPCGQPTSVWTRQLAADVASAAGITPRRVSGEAMRHALAALKARWQRAKPWITSPDPADARTQNRATASSG